MNANGVGHIEKKARQGGMAKWGRRQDEKKPSADSFKVFKPSISPASEYLIGQYAPDDRYLTEG